MRGGQNNGWLYQSDCLATDSGNQLWFTQERNLLKGFWVTPRITRNADDKRKILRCPITPGQWARARDKSKTPEWLGPSWVWAGASCQPQAPPKKLATGSCRVLPMHELPGPLPTASQSGEQFFLWTGHLAQHCPHLTFPLIRSQCKFFQNNLLLSSPKHNVQRSSINTRRADTLVFPSTPMLGIPTACPRT